MQEVRNKTRGALVAKNSRAWQVGWKQERIFFQLRKFDIEVSPRLFRMTEWDISFGTKINFISWLPNIASMVISTKSYPVWHRYIPTKAQSSLCGSFLALECGHQKKETDVGQGRNWKNILKNLPRLWSKFYGAADRGEKLEYGWPTKALYIDLIPYTILFQLERKVMNIIFSFPAFSNRK